MKEKTLNNDDELLEIVPPKVSDHYFNTVIKPYLDFIEKWARINEEFLGEK
jgi:hypothetical protein